MSNFARPIGLPVWGLGWTYGVESSTNRNVDCTFLFDFYTHYRPYSHRLDTITMQQTTDRQTQQEAHQLVGQTKRRATKIRPKAV